MEKGKSFELKVMESLERELRRAELPFAPDAARVHHHKRYYSRERGSYVTTDVCLEVTRPNADEACFIWVWECKDYDHAVPVDDIEEFHSKLEQIGLHNTKGTVICRDRYQKAAVAFAKSKAIGLARALPDGTIHRITEAVRTVSQQAVESGLAEEDAQTLESLFYALSTCGQGVTDFSALFRLEMEGLR